MKKIISWLPMVALLAFSIWAAGVMFDAGFELKETGSLTSLLVFAGIAILWFAVYALYLMVESSANKAMEE